MVGSIPTIEAKLEVIMKLYFVLNKDGVPTGGSSRVINVYETEGGARKAAGQLRRRTYRKDAPYSVAFGEFPLQVLGD